MKTFEEAKKYTKTLNLKTVKEWYEYSKTDNKPNDISTNPNRTYKNKGWMSWGDFLGTGNIAPINKIFKSFEDAKTFVKTLNLKSQTEWFKYSKSGDNPDDIPNNPYNSYKNRGWVSWGDFLGNGNIANVNKKYRSFEEVKIFIEKLRLNSWREWVEYCKSGNKPNDIPSAPYHVYKNKGWNGVEDFLGNDKQ